MPTTEIRPALISLNARAFYGAGDSPKLVTFVGVDVDRVVIEFESGERAVQPRAVAEVLAKKGTQTWLASRMPRYFPEEAADLQRRLAA